MMYFSLLHFDNNRCNDDTETARAKSEPACEAAPLSTRILSISLIPVQSAIGMVPVEFGARTASAVSSFVGNFQRCITTHCNGHNGHNFTPALAIRCNRGTRLQSLGIKLQSFGIKLQPGTPSVVTNQPSGCNAVTTPSQLLYRVCCNAVTTALQVTRNGPYYYNVVKTLLT